MASVEDSFIAYIDLDNPAFYKTGDMIFKITDYCKKTGQRIPEGIGQISRCIFESLAIKYRIVMDELEGILGYRFENIHMVGGGIQNKLLCQFAANALGREIKAGPVEATVYGNLILQGIALGSIKNYEDGRKIIKASCKIVNYEPHNISLWEAAVGKARKMI